ncbi:hypothetical protein NBT05_09970 [Aquimarina sp. ERC-38]|uniref:hypothetical protein n=1 Tax=Aquimarina sp. ERC-38 TaxID=2949996 RepID=UPI002248122F|nr:hypothetical protein [Aquimarina sp. ERC-38]UZO79297.1 hypothetical protein NBT05_09970 [Aquimarina sp. ERC-38]
MKLFIILSLAIPTLLFANTEKEALEVRQEGQIVTVTNFEEGNKIKVFETVSGVHVLSKKRGQIDLSQLPEGSYTIIDNSGRTVEVINTGEIVEIDETTNEFLITEDAPLVVENEDSTAEEQPLNDFTHYQPLKIKQVDNSIEILDFTDGDIIKVFEFENDIHVLTKKYNVIDLSQLPSGKYYLKNNKRQIAVVEKTELLTIE